MTTPERFYNGSVRVLSLAMIAIGVVLLGLTLAGGGGPLSLGFLLGIAFLAVGAGRLWLAGRINP